MSDAELARVITRINGFSVKEDLVRRFRQRKGLKKKRGKGQSGLA